MKTLFSRFFLIFFRSRLSGAALVATIVGVFAGWPGTALAAPPLTVGEVMCNAWYNMVPYDNLINAIAWTMGGILIGMGLLHLKNYHDSPHNHPVYQGILKIAGGGALMTLPFFTNAIFKTIYTVPGPGGASTCTAGAVVGPLPDLVTMLENMVGNIEVPLFQVIAIVGWVTGILFIAMGIVKASKYGTDPRGSSIPNILIYLVIGGLLIASGESLGTMLGTLFGIGSFATIDYVTSQATVMSWAAVTALGGNAAFGYAISAGLTFIQLVGGLAFFRGLYIVKNAAEGTGQATMAQGFTHLIGGAIAVNIFTFLEAMDSTFGTALL